MSRAAAALALALALALAGCGRKAAPHAPDNAFYPQLYPGLVLPNPPSVTKEEEGQKEYLQMQAIEKSDAAKNAPKPAPVGAPPPPVTFDDLHHPQADTTTTTTMPATTPAPTPPATPGAAAP